MKLLPGMLALLASSQIVYADINKDELQFVQSMKTMYDYAEKHQNEVWPNFHPGPHVIFFADVFDPDPNHQHLWGLNIKPVNLPWEKVEENEYYLDHNPIDPYLLAYSGQIHEVDSQPVYVYLYWGDDQYFYNSLSLSRANWYIKHESAIDKKSMKNLSVGYNAFLLPDNVKLTFLEDAALTATLRDKGSEAEAELQDAVAIHQYRQSLLSNDNKNFEQTNELIYGTSYYISWNSEHLSDDDYIRKTQLTGCQPLNGAASVYTGLNCTVLGMPAFASTTFGRALDKHLSSRDWKISAEKHSIPASTLMQYYYHMSDAQAEALVKNAMNNPKYNYARISRLIDGSDILPYVKATKNAQAKYDQIHGVELYIPLDYLFFVFSTELYYIDTKSVLSEDVTEESAIYSLPEYKELARYHFENMEYAYSDIKFDDFNNLDFIKSSIIMKISEDSLLDIDGVKTSVADFIKSGQIANFHKLNISGPHIEATYFISGTLDGSDGSLKLINLSPSSLASNKTIKKTLKHGKNAKHFKPVMMGPFQQNLSSF